MMIFSDKHIRACEFKIITGSSDSQSIEHIGTNAYITLTGGAIRFRIDGGSPNTTEGHILSDRQSIELTNESSITNFKFIQASNIPSILTITYGRI